jgi:hypothetical protein
MRRTPDEPERRLRLTVDLFFTPDRGDGKGDGSTCDTQMRAYWYPQKPFASSPPRPDREESVKLLNHAIFTLEGILKSYGRTYEAPAVPSVLFDTTTGEAVEIQRIEGRNPDPA